MVGFLHIHLLDDCGMVRRSEYKAGHLVVKDMVQGGMSEEGDMKHRVVYHISTHFYSGPVMVSTGVRKILLRWSDDLIINA